MATARRPIGQGVKFRRPLTPDASPPTPLGADFPQPGTPGITPGSLPPVQDEAPIVPDDLVAVGRILDAYGIRGWVKVEAFNQAEDSVLLHVRRWWLRPSSPRRAHAVLAAASMPLPHDIERVRSHSGVLVAKPIHANDRDQAVVLKGSEVLVSRADFPASQEGEFYWGDMVGCMVVNVQGVPLGEVFAVEDYGAHPILRLKQAEGPERMVPFIDIYVVSVDLAARRIVVDWSPDY